MKYKVIWLQQPPMMVVYRKNEIKAEIFVIFIFFLLTLFLSFICYSRLIYLLRQSSSDFFRTLDPS